LPQKGSKRKKRLFTANHAKNANKGNSVFAYFAYFAVIHSGIWGLWRLEFMAIGDCESGSGWSAAVFDVAIFCHFE
jgi:hypothetical protein